MRILVLTDNFVPEIAAPAFRVRDHARVWVERGHDVTVVTCAPNWPHGRPLDGYRNRLYQEEWIDGVRVIRLWTYMAANRGFFKRGLDYLSFMLSVVFFCWRFPRFDVLLATSPQFLTAVAGWTVSLIRRRPWVFEVRDLWPASIRAVGSGRGAWLGLLERIELFLYRRARRIIAVTGAIREDIVRRGVSREKIDVVTNGVDPQRFSRTVVDRSARAELGIPLDAHLVGYVGTTGMAHGLETVLEAAGLLSPRENVWLLIMGEGARRRQLEQLAGEMRLRNVVFRGQVAQSEIARFYAALDSAVIHLRPDPVFRTVIPSKLFELMAMQVPVVLAAEGEAAGMVRLSGCGVCVPPAQPVELARAIERLSLEPGTLHLMGRRGRQWVREHGNRSAKALAALESLMAAAEDPRAVPARPESAVAPRRRAA